MSAVFVTSLCAGLAVLAGVTFGAAVLVLRRARVAESRSRSVLSRAEEHFARSATLHEAGTKALTDARSLHENCGRPQMIAAPIGTYPVTLLNRFARPGSA